MINPFEDAQAPTETTAAAKKVKTKTKRWTAQFWMPTKISSPRSATR
jgi:hypothetical protein